jgi:hypothetical protein
VAAGQSRLILANIQNGLSIGPFASQTYNIASGHAKPIASDFTINSVKISDTSGNPISGLTISIQGISYQ